ncbi:MAG: T9SS type A sorting domain-containing protein [Salinivirgaceae bacterium]|nr:T9SS type A sorting domain-containing protein [Salinivirgaceae bacterium]
MEGVCGNVNGISGTARLNPKDFNYIQSGNYFEINCAFAKNCGQGGYLTVQANEETIKIEEYVVDTGEVLTCQDYDEFSLTFPLPLYGDFNINISGFDTIISGLTIVKDIVNQNIRIYPNPFNDYITVDIVDEIECKSYKIIDLQGQTKSIGYLAKDKYSIDLSMLANGIYFIKIQDSHTKETLKIDRIIKK